MSQPTFTLNDGNEIPFLAFGTGTRFFRQDVTEPTSLAIAKGFTHLDGAQMYQNEETLGAAIKASGKPRESFFVTTKLSSPLEPGDTVSDALRKSLARLGLDYVNLYLIHTPRRSFKDNLKETWKGMEGAKRLGLTKSIGISNSGTPEIEEILSVAEIVPAVNQESTKIEFHPYFLSVHGPTYELNKKHGIRTAAYSGLAPLHNAKGGPLDPIIGQLAETLSRRAGKPVSPAQVLGKWHQAKGNVFVSTSSKAERLEEYLAIPRLPDLSEEEVKLIDDTGRAHFCHLHPGAYPLLDSEKPAGK